MKRGVIALAVLGALFIGVVWIRERTTTPPATKSGATIRTSTRPAPKQEVSASASLPEAPSLALIQGDGERSASAWETRALAVTLRARTAKFGREVAELSMQPPDRAWPALTRLARDGDVAAAAMAMQIAVECQNADGILSRYALHPRVEIADRSYPALGPGWKSFVDRVATLQQDRERERLRHCSDIGGTMDFALLMFERLFAPDSPEARLELAAELDDDDDAIAGMRAAAGEIGTLEARRRLARRLMESKSVDRQAEGEATLKLLADGDPESARELEVCYAYGCGAFRPRKDEAGAWIERVAAAGDAMALHEQVARLEAARSESEAWAWSLYALELARSGCLEIETPTYVAIARAASDEERVRAKLTPAAQNAGQTIAYGIADRYGLATKRRLGCAD